jgi:predicted DNA-binding transcriptional regulator YafY
MRSPGPLKSRAGISRSSMLPTPPRMLQQRASPSKRSQVSPRRFRWRMRQRPSRKPKSPGLPGMAAPGCAGWVQAELPTEPDDYAARQLLRLGTEVELLAPASLRSAFAREAAAVARRHAAPSNTTGSIGPDRLSASAPRSGSPGRCRGCRR